MALGSVLPAAGVETVAYTVPAGKRASVNVNICNKGEDIAYVRVSLGSGATAGASEPFEWDLPLDPAGNPGNTSERSGITMTAGEKIFVYSSNGDVAFNVTGIEGVA